MCPMTRSSGLMRETEGRRTDGRKKKEKENYEKEKKERKKAGFAVFCHLSITEVQKPCDSSLIHYPVQYIRGQYCTLPAVSTLILCGEDLQC